MIISIVGKSGSGKSSISRMLNDLDDRFMHIDVDQISHFVLTIPDVLKEIECSFGERVINNGAVDRKKLGKIVFSSSEAMDELTRITWPYMEKIIDSTISNNPNKIFLLDWILLPKTKYFDMSILKIWVDAPFDERERRVIDRSEGTVTHEYFLKRDNAGVDYEDCLYDFFIDNKDLAITKLEVKKIYEKRIISG